MVNLCCDQALIDFVNKGKYLDHTGCKWVSSLFTIVAVYRMAVKVYPVIFFFFFFVKTKFYTE